ncbi:MAG: hypothetical protein DME86_02400 [Verrucomicrobia bacterium]|nr:MAG: hypothetical protein DME86_02400 [Verrucomicrobiota bacterium]
MITVQHLKALRLPPSPLPDIAQKTNRQVGHAKVEIDQISGAFAVNIPALGNHASTAHRLLRNRIDL